MTIYNEGSENIVTQSTENLFSTIPLSFSSGNPPNLDRNHLFLYKLVQ